MAPGRSPLSLRNVHYHRASLPPGLLTVHSTFSRRILVASKAEAKKGDWLSAAIRAWNEAEREEYEKRARLEARRKQEEEGQEQKQRRAQAHHSFACVT
jgi:hypothetical protein